jgi:hypothetical protein
MIWIKQGESIICRFPRGVGDGIHEAATPAMAEWSSVLASSIHQLQLCLLISIALR